MQRLFAYQRKKERRKASHKSHSRHGLPSSCNNRREEGRRRRREEEERRETHQPPLGREFSHCPSPWQTEVWTWDGTEMRDDIRQDNKQQTGL